MNTISIIEQNRDRRSRTAEITIGEKKVITPNFSVRIKNLTELNAFINFRYNASLSHVSSCVFKYTDVSNLMQSLLNDDLTKYFPNMKIEETPTKNFMKKVPIIIDPSMDSLYYSSEVANFDKRGLTLDPAMRKYILDYGTRNKSVSKGRLTRSAVNKWRNKNLNEFWRKIRDKDDVRTKFIENMLKEQIKFRSDIPVAPTPLITSDEMLEIAIKVNDKSRELARSLNETCATSFYFQSSILSDYNALGKVVQYIRNDYESPLTVFKFKNIDLTDVKKIFPRKNYRTLLLDLDYLSQKDDKIFMILENGVQTFISSLVGFHLVSSGFDGFDKVGGGFRGGPFGSWYDTLTMTWRSFKKEIEPMFEEHNRLLCDCEVCRKYKSLPSNVQEWYVDRRIHHIIQRNQDNSMIVDSIDKGDIIHALDKLGRSEISILKKCLPY